MKRDLMPAIALAVGTVLILFSIQLSGDLINFWSLSSLIIVLLGSLSAIMVAYPLEDMKRIPQVLKNLFYRKDDNLESLVASFASLSRTARRDGLLALEDELENVEDEFTVRCFQMVIDGIDPEIIEDVMEIDIETTKVRHQVSHNIFRTWGELAPAFGMVGTLIGLIVMLADLNNSADIGSGMAVALVTTFYGALIANLVLNPIAANLQLQTDKEVFRREMIVTGILEIQAGTNPNILEQKMLTYLKPADRELYQEKKDGGQDLWQEGSEKQEKAK